MNLQTDALEWGAKEERESVKEIVYRVSIELTSAILPQGINFRIFVFALLFDNTEDEHHTEYLTVNAIAIVLSQYSFIHSFSSVREFSFSLPFIFEPEFFVLIILLSFYFLPIFTKKAFRKGPMILVDCLESQ